MMKKYLLLTGLSLLMTAQTFAQAELTKAPKTRAEFRQTVSNIGVAPVPAKMNTTSERLFSAKKAPRKSVSNGVWYQRPEGALWIRGNSGGITLLPMYTEQIWTNMYKTPETATWTVVTSSGTTQLEGDEDNNYASYYGNGGYYAPTINRGRTSFNIGDMIDEDGNPVSTNYLYTMDSLVWSTQHVNAAAGMYYGFSDGGVFGTTDRKLQLEDGTVVNARVDAIHEVFNKPARPLYISSFYFYAASEQDVAIPDGCVMKLVVRKQGEESLFGETIAEIPFTMADTLYTDDGNSWAKKFAMFEVKQIEKDGFGSEVQVPVIVDDAFVVSIEGFEQEGVNFTLYMVDVKSTDIDYYETTGNVVPTLRSYINKDTGEELDILGYCQYIDSEMSAKYNEEDGDNYDWTRQYNACIMLNSMYDVVDPYDDFRSMIAPVEGGNIYIEAEEENEVGTVETVRYTSFQYQTTLPRISTWEGLEGEDNYFFEDMPEWLHIGEFNDDNFADYGVTLVTIIADPLPAGEKGRKAEFRVVSDRGADSGIITVVQGEDTDAIVTVSTDLAKKPQPESFNLAGQKVSNGFKGLTVKNGKKFFVK